MEQELEENNKNNNETQIHQQNEPLISQSQQQEPAEKPDKATHCVETILKDISQYKSTDLSCKIPAEKQHRFSIAPMFDVSNVHFRFFIRLLTRYSTLWTEMYHATAITDSPKRRALCLRLNHIEHPVCCQLGGNDPDLLTEAAKHVEKAGFDEVDINCGCPSSKVKAGAFGACLMKDPERVAKCVKAMQEAVSIPVHVKCRIGVDEQDSYDFVKKYVEVISGVGCKHFIVHARKAYLKGLNPAQNRNIPPLKYDVVVRLKKDFPGLDFTINGGFKTHGAIEEILKEENGLYGCMVGRLALHNPWVLSDIDRRVFGLENQRFSRREVLRIYGAYIDDYLKENPKVKWPTLIKPIVPLFKGCKSAGVYKRVVSDRARHKGMKVFSELMELAIKEMEEANVEALDERPP